MERRYSWEDFSERNTLFHIQTRWGGGGFPYKKDGGGGVLSYLLGIKKRELGGPLGVYADCAFTFNIISWSLFFLIRTFLILQSFFSAS